MILQICIYFCDFHSNASQQPLLQSSLTSWARRHFQPTKTLQSSSDATPLVGLNLLFNGWKKIANYNPVTPSSSLLTTSPTNLHPPTITHLYLILPHPLPTTTPPTPSPSMTSNPPTKASSSAFFQTHLDLLTRSSNFTSSVRLCCRLMNGINGKVNQIS